MVDPPQNPFRIIVNWKIELNLQSILELWKSVVSFFGDLFRLVHWEIRFYNLVNLSL